MANIIGVVSPKENKESLLMLDKIKSDLKIFPWLRHDTFNKRNLFGAIASIPSAPLFFSTNEHGDFALVLGHMFPEKRGNDQAEQLLRHYTNTGPQAFDQNGDFYLACLYLANGTLMLSTDCLGIFPLYYAALNDEFLFATSPNLINKATGQRPAIDIVGLVGHLLTMHMVGEQTIWQGVLRLPPGNVLIWRANQKLILQPTNQLRCSSESFGKPLHECFDEFDAVLEQVTKPSQENLSILLTGGLDSRTIAGYLATRHHKKPTCFTLGNKLDNEYFCARQVAHRLSLRHELLENSDNSPEQFLNSAQLQLNNESLANGFNDLSWWSIVSQTGTTEQLQYNGLVGGASAGADNVYWAYDKDSQTFTFEKMFEAINRWGLSAQVLGKLIPTHVLKDAVQTNINILRNLYASNEGLPFQNSWYFDLVTRQRLHVGAHNWRMSFSSWPVMPFADKRLLRTLAGMPGAIILERRAQRQLLMNQFSNLATLPVDRNSTDLSPLLRPGLGERTLMRLKLFTHSRRANGIERLHYQRVYDINNANWRALRSLADNNLHALSDIMNPEQVRAIIGDPDVHFDLSSRIADASGKKMLLGFVLLDKQ